MGARADLALLQAMGDRATAMADAFEPEHVGNVLHPTPYTLYPTPCTLYPTPYTLYHAPCTLNPEP